MVSDATIKAEVSRAMRQGRRIQQAVRDITLKALTRAELDRAGVAKVTREVLDAVHEAAAVQGESARSAMKQALDGVDQALAHAAQALKLSIDEAAGRAQQFSREDLAKARSDLAELQRMFLDTLRATARAGRGAAKAVLEDLAHHAEASGTAVGHQLGEAGGLSARLARAGQARFEAGLHAAAASGAMLARIAAGVLAGIAEAVEKPPKRRR